jgi:DNA-binding NtrC family response regulator
MSGRKVNVFVVEDDPVYREMLSDLLKKHYPRATVDVFASGEAALQAARKPDILILDYWLNREKRDAMDGLEVLGEGPVRWPGARTVIVSAQENIDISVSMMKYGAYDYIVKGETDSYRLRNALNHIITLIDYDERIRRTRRALAGIAMALVVVTLYILLGQAP